MYRTFKILIADDDPGFLSALSVRLKSQGFDVITASDSYNALAKAKNENPDVMLLDVNMPAGDGFSVQERMKGDDGTNTIPVIYLTGDKSERLDEIAEELGAVALFHKPIRMSILIQAIHAVITPRAA